MNMSYIKMGYIFTRNSKTMVPDTSSVLTVTIGPQILHPRHQVKSKLAVASVRIMIAQLIMCIQSMSRAETGTMSIGFPSKLCTFFDLNHLVTAILKATFVIV